MMTGALEKLKMAKDLQTFAPLLGFRPKSISFLLFKMDPTKRYREFSIPKKSGGTRNISAPNVELLLLQKRLKELLFLCIVDIEKSDPIRANRRIAHGARKHYSIYTNSVRHKGKKFVCNLDLKEFFPSINFGRVRGYFIKNDRFALDPKVATLIAQISCHNNCLPQGSPSSSLIADLIAGSLDQRLNKIAQDNNCSYTRYIDDITLSTNKSAISDHIAFLAGNELKEWQIGEALRSGIERSGFEINEKKFRVQYFSGRQTVTGLVVNQKININTEYTRKVRAMVNNYYKNGASYEVVKQLDEQVVIEVSPMRLRGMLTHIFWIKGREFKYRRFSDKEKEIEPNFMKQYRQFLDFYSFFDNNAPIILCEGKTDHIYLKCALMQIGKNYPLLTKKEDGALLVKFFKYGKHSLPVQRLGGGCGDIGLLIGQFSRRTAQFTSEKRKGPLIIVVDNDKAAKTVFSAAKEVGKFKENVDGSKDFYDLGNRVFLVAIPKGNKKTDFPIESLFKSEVMQVRLGGKTLSLEENFDEKKHYGKYLLAEKVVRPNQDKIDFSGFAPLLDRISAAVLFDAEQGRRTHP